MIEETPEKKAHWTEDRNATPEEICEALTEYLKSIPYKEDTIFGYMDYLSGSWPISRDLYDKPIPAFQYIICYPVQGSSEGWYFHIEVYGIAGERVHLLTGKTLNGMEDALNINTEINRFILRSW